MGDKIFHVENYKYIYNLPYIQRAELCEILNQNNKWAELAGHLNFTVDDIQKLKLEKNPTDELLTKWGHSNHAIYELFAHLSKMQHYRAMLPLKNFVSPKLHRLLENGEGNLQNIFKDPGKDSKIGTHNFDQNDKPHRNSPKVILDQGSKKESKKILNKTVHQEYELPSNSNNLLVPMTETILPNIPYQELAVATNNWDKKTNLLGKGGYGHVYRGYWKNTKVAVKKFEKSLKNDHSEQHLEQSVAEIKILNSSPHDNILQLFAYSLGGETPCLVYQLMEKGSLQDRLKNKNKDPPLDWKTRRAIAAGVACGLQYLHTARENKPVIHGDIKSGNILLDKHFQPKIGDFGLAREGSCDYPMKVTKVQGTLAYAPPELSQGILSIKTDTYCYGIVLFELATNLQAYVDGDSKKKLKNYVDQQNDENILALKAKDAGEDNNIFEFLINIGKWCTNYKDVTRPEMKLVYEKF